MKKIVLGIALAVGVSTAASAKGIKPDIAIVSDTCLLYTSDAADE